MGTYLATGIVQEIAIDKRRIKYPDITVYSTTQQLNNYVKPRFNIVFYGWKEHHGMLREYVIL